MLDRGVAKANHVLQVARGRAYTERTDCQFSDYELGWPGARRRRPTNRLSGATYVTSSLGVETEWSSTFEHLLVKLDTELMATDSGVLENR